MVKRLNFFTSFLILSIFITGGLAFYSAKKVQKVNIPVTDFAKVEVSVTPTPPLDLEILSPDGKYKLIQKTKILDGITTSTILSGPAGDNEPLGNIYEEESIEESAIKIPFNTFSPNNKFIFLSYFDTGTQKYIVLPTDGKDFREGEKFVEITALFYDKHPEFIITDVTGWAANNLLLVNTNIKETGEIGPSWWFDLTNLSFIRLHSRFN